MAPRPRSAILACVQASSPAPAATGTEALTQDLFQFLRKVMSDTNRDVFAAVEDAGLTITQVKCLKTLNEADAPLSLGALSTQIGLSLAGISRAVDGLVREGHVSRTEDPRDRRSRLVQVTARGRRTYERLLELRIAGIRMFVDGLEPREQEALGAALAPLVARWSA